MECAEIKRRFDKLVSMRQVVQETWNTIERYIAPYRGRFFKDERNEESIEWRKPFIYDSTAVSASQMLASHIHSSLTSPKIKWFEMRFRDTEIAKDHSASVWVDQVTEIMYKVLQDSNFDPQAAETYQDLVDFGTSVITEFAESEPTEEWKGLNFQSVPIKFAYFEQDHKGNVYNFYRKFEWTPIQIIEKFGRENCPQCILDKINNGCDVEKKEIVIFCVYRRDHIDLDEINVLQPIAPDARPYGYKYILHASAEVLGKPGGYYEMPAFVPRWRTTSSSMWGNSPAMVALSDTMTLNRLIELYIQAMEKVIDPVIFTTRRGLMGDLDLSPGGLNVVKDVNEFRPFESSARFDVVFQEIARLRDQIREYFMIDQLMLPPMEGTPATATEIAARISQLERLLGSTLGRLQKDFLDQMLLRTFNICFRGGLFPDLPESLSGRQAALDIEYVGALARAQEHDQVDSVERWLMQVMNIAQTRPEVMDVPDWDSILRGNAKLLGVPAKYVADETKVKRLRDQREAAAAEMQNAQMAQQEGDAMKAIGEGQQAMTGT